MTTDAYNKQIGGNHYKDMAIQPSEFINKNKLQFAEGNAIKYICRHSLKGGKQDLEKAKHYIDMIIERDYPEDTPDIDINNPIKIDTSDIEVTYEDMKGEADHREITRIAKYE